MLSEEQAIENLKDFKSISIVYGNTFTMFLEQLKKYQEATDTVLNLITKLQKENEEKDKQIDLMAKIFYKRFKAELLLEYGFESEEQLKQYFTNKVNSKIQ